MNRRSHAPARSILHAGALFASAIVVVGPSLLLAADPPQPSTSPPAAVSQPPITSLPPVVSAPGIPPPPPPGEAAVEEVVVAAPEPRYVAPTTRDRIGRIWAPVLIDGRGPYRLVLDTGASKSALVPRVVAELGLPVKTAGARVHGVTGSAVVETVRVKSLEFGELRVDDTTLPVVADVFGGADGVLGGDGLRDKRILIEFGRDRITIMRSRRQAAATGFHTIPFERLKNYGLKVPIRVGPIQADAVIDTGGQATVGNLALREALARHRGEKDPYDDTVIGVTLDAQQATRVRVPTIVMGSLVVRGATVPFADLEIFKHWSLHSRPTLLIGMDVLGTLDTLVVDYRLDELHVKPRR
jgi:predicted aspartyl protease